MMILKKTAVSTCIVARVKNPKNVHPELVKPLLPSISITNEPSSRYNNSVLFERTEVKLFSINGLNVLNTEDKMDTSLKNENVYAQNSVKSTNNEDDIASLLSVNSPSTPKSMNIESTFDTLNIKIPCIKQKTLLIAASRINASDTSHCRFLKRGIQTLTDELAIRYLKLKTVQQTVGRQKKKIVTIKTIIKKLQKENLIH